MNTDKKLAEGHIFTTQPDGVMRQDYLFRVSIKAVIYNDDGELLVVKEHGLNWGLPGGGLDFGETFEQALARELEEEVGYSGGFTFDVIDVANPMYLKGIDAYQVYVVCWVQPEDYDFSIGVDGEDMRFIDPNELDLFDDSQAKYAKYFHERLQERLERHCQGSS